MARFLVIKMKENNSKLFFFSSLMAVKVDLNEIVFCFCCNIQSKGEGRLKSELRKKTIPPGRDLCSVSSSHYTPDIHKKYKYQQYPFAI
jgi:hypothetical protein